MRIVYPWQHDYVEGLVLYISHLLNNGVNIYAAKPSVDSFTAASYPLLAFMPTALINLFSTNSAASLVFSRLIFFTASLCNLTLAYYLAANGKRFTGYLAILILLCLRPFTYWSCLIRVDVLALTFILLSLYAFQTRRFTLLVLSLSLTLLIKQQYLDLPLALILCSLSKLDKEALKSISISVGLVALSYALFEYVFPGFLKSILFYNLLHAKSFFHACKIFYYAYGYEPWALAMLTFALATSLHRVVVKRDLNVIYVYMLINVFFSFAASLKLGSNTNYYIVSSALTAIILSKFLQSHNINRLSKDRQALLIVVFLFSAAMWNIVNVAGFNLETYREGMATVRVFQDLKCGKLVWCDNLLIAYLANLKVSIDPFYYTQLVEAHVLPDVSELNWDIYALIWTGNPYRVTSGVEALVDEGVLTLAYSSEYLSVYVSPEIADDVITAFSKQYAVYYLESLRGAFHAMDQLLRALKSTMEFWKVLAYSSIVIYSFLSISSHAGGRRACMEDV